MGLRTFKIADLNGFRQEALENFLKKKVDVFVNLPGTQYIMHVSNIFSVNFIFLSLKVWGDLTAYLAIEMSLTMHKDIANYRSVKQIRADNSGNHAHLICHSTILRLNFT